MKLTGKAKEKFEAWFELNPSSKTKAIEFINFEELPNSMKWGVYQDFADSEGYEIEVYVSFLRPLRFGISIKKIEDDKLLVHSPNHATRQEAQKAVIKKLNELINEK